MSEAVAEAARLLRARLNKIKDERQRLEKALKSLEPGKLRASRRDGRASRANGRRRKRAPRGHREAQFLEQVKNAPGSRVSEVAKAIGVSPQQLYAVARRLEDEGKVVKRDRGYAVAKASGS